LFFQPGRGIVLSAWDVRAADLVSFYGEHGHYPQAKRAGGEGSLYGWLFVQRRRAAKSTLQAECAAHLDNVLPGWKVCASIDWNERWLQSAHALSAFVEQYGRFPSRSSEDSDERTKGTWLARQRHQLKRDKLRDDRRAYLDRLVSNWSKGRPKA